jgi:hypothetical protein
MYWNGPGSEIPQTINYGKSNSMEGQDQWVLNSLSGKREGTYVEIGGGHPVIGNNTYLLESEFNWRGVSIEIDDEMSALYNDTRENPCINHDAITFDYREYFAANNFPKQIDYLQIDIDDQPKQANLLGLIALPLSEYRFSLMTIEHGVITDYRMTELRSAQRLILSSFGYRLIVQGVNEDWWVDTSVIPYDKYGYSFRIG